MSEQMEEIKERFIHPRATSLNIKRIPIDTVEKLKELANNEFVGDYGLAMKSVLDYYFEEQVRLVQIYGMIEDHERRLHNLESPQTKKSIKVLSGRGIRELPKEENKEEEKNVINREV